VDRLAIFWPLIALATVVFFIGAGWNVAVWLQGAVHGDPRLSAGRKLWLLLGDVAGVLFSRRLWLVVQAAVRDALFHRRLQQTSLLRWGAHLSLLVSLGALFALSLLTGFCQEILYGIFGVNHPLVLAIMNKDTPVMALANEILGLIALPALGLVFYRRWGRREAQLLNAAPDLAILVLLAVILVTGYPLESFRLLAENVPPAQAVYSFIGYPLALALRPLGWPWPTVHFWAFLLHAVLNAALIAYLPFSKFWHVFASPLVAVANTLQEISPEIDLREARPPVVVEELLREVGR
jgi:nitrate reductase gamma subunit